MWKERTVGGLPAPGVATAMVHTHLLGHFLQVLGVVLVLGRAVSRVGVNTHTVTPIPIKVTQCQSWEMDTCPLLSVSAAIQNQACFDFPLFQFWDKFSWCLIHSLNSAGLERERRKERQRKRAAGSSWLRSCSITQLRRQQIHRESRSQDTSADEVGNPFPTTSARTGLPVSLDKPSSKENREIRISSLYYLGCDFCVTDLGEGEKDPLPAIQKHPEVT